MDTKIIDKLRHVITEVLEQFAFMLAEYDDISTNEASARRFLQARMMFGGSKTYSLTLAATDSLCRQIAANALGTSGGRIKAQALEDAFKELLNIVCGSLATALFGDKIEVPLTIPEIKRISRKEWDRQCSGSNTIVLNVEGQPMAVMLEAGRGKTRRK